MGTTAEKGAYLNNTKLLLKQKINNLGGDITDNTTFRQYAEQLQNVYDILPKTDYEEGSNITLSNTLKGKLDYENDIVGIGQTEQETTNGYNLVDISSGTTSSLVGVSTSISGDIVTLNGSRTDGSTSNAVRIINEINKFNISSSDTYKMTLNVISGTYTGRVGLTFLNSSGTTLAYIETATDGTTASKSLTFSEQISKISFFFNGDFSANNFKFQIMLQKGTSTINYEKYTGGQASPNPSYPQEIEVVRGKNILDISKIVNSGTLNGVTCTVNDDTISFSGTATGNGIIAYIPITLEKGTYTFSFEGSAKNTYNTKSIITLRSNTNAWVQDLYSTETYASGTINVTEKTTYRVSFNIVVGYTYNSTTYNLKPMLEKGSQATPYLPYNTIEVVERGKNAFAFETNSTKTWYGLDIIMNNSSVTINGTSTNTSSVYAYGFNLKPLKLIGTYKLSGYTRNDSYLQLYWKDKNGNIKYKEMKNNPTITFDEGDYLFQLFIFASSGTIMTFNNETFNIMLEKGDTITNFIPYEETTKQLFLGNFKPSKIGNYKDYFYRTNGKNKFDNSVERKNAYIGASSSDIGTAITYYNSSATYSYVNCAYVEAGKTYTLSWKQSTTPASTNNRIGAIVDNNNIVLAVQQTWINTATQITFTPSVSGYLVLCTDINATNIQLELSSTATDYNPYGNGEWYFKEKNGYTMLKSALGWIQAPSSVAEGTTRFYCNKSDVANLQATQSKDILSNAFMPLTWNEIYLGDTTTKNAISDYSQENSVANRIVIRIDSNYASSVSELNTFLDNNDFYAYYLKAIPTDTKITDTTMITQLEEIYNLMSYNGTTIIEINGQLPLIIKVRALKGN